MAKIFEKKREENGKRSFYLFGRLLFSYRLKKIKIFPRCDIYNRKLIRDNNICLPHPIGIVISRAATIGKNCVIYQNVTIGSRNYHQGDRDPKNYPTIGNNVIIYAGAVVAGPITVGDNAIIGANAVVLHDVPANAVVAGVPAKVIKQA